MRAFVRLAERDREALRLVAWDGLSLADAARVAGTTRVAFATRVHRARRRLAAALDEQSDRGHPSPQPRLESSP
jgi:RNA polymerase sigma-70 factor (ECF subfamily)